MAKYMPESEQQLLYSLNVTDNGDYKPRTIEEDALAVYLGIKDGGYSGKFNDVFVEELKQASASASVSAFADADADSPVIRSDPIREEHYDNHTYLATPALAADADIVKVNFKELPFVEPEPLHASLKNTMHYYGRVSQIHMYVDLATGLYEGEAMVILDITPLTDYMSDDDEPYYKPLTRKIFFDNWDANIPSIMEKCPPSMLLLQSRSHQQRNCRVRKEDEKCKRYTAKIDRMSADELLATYPKLTQKIQNLQEQPQKQQQQQKEQAGKQQQSANGITTLLPSVNNNKIGYVYLYPPSHPPPFAVRVGPHTLHYLKSSFMLK
ncbi:hypothetical protein INT45_006816 [Circinella minor]|uniref:Uncharacterized protein n=1 Tax=Circinella minor TaxID=1195481 RepID=A0A8H7RR77_9FUNG|nr:hypothetical protein INT45_006816 [Circinella minor]